MLHIIFSSRSEFWLAYIAGLDSIGNSYYRSYKNELQALTTTDPSFPLQSPCSAVKGCLSTPHSSYLVLTLVQHFSNVFRTLVSTRLLSLLLYSFYLSALATSHYLAQTGMVSLSSPVFPSLVLGNFSPCAIISHTEDCQNLEKYFLSIFFRYGSSQ